MGYEKAQTGRGRDFDIEGFPQSPRYQNHVLPAIRGLPGFGDNGEGEFRIYRAFAEIDEDPDYGPPIEAKAINSHVLVEDIANAWEMDVRDAPNGRDREYEF